MRTRKNPIKSIGRIDVNYIHKFNFGLSLVAIAAIAIPWCFMYKIIKDSEEPKGE